MDIGKMTIKAIEQLVFAEKPDASLLEACRQDERPAVQRILRRFEREQAERQRVDALYQYEYAAREDGVEYVAGVDEAGRGPLAGPVVVAAVILPLGCFLPKLNDSKKLSPKARDVLYDLIQENAISVGCAIVDEKTIDRINIYHASHRAMHLALEQLDPQPDHVLVDGRPVKSMRIPHTPLVKGDARSYSIAAASVLAKVTRDRMMQELDQIYPAYGFASHKGYATPQHLAAIEQHGACPIHRKTFSPFRPVETEQDLFAEAEMCVSVEPRMDANSRE